MEIKVEDHKVEKGRKVIVIRDSKGELMMTITPRLDMGVVTVTSKYMDLKGILPDGRLPGLPSILIPLMKEEALARLAKERKAVKEN